MRRVVTILLLVGVALAQDDDVRAQAETHRDRGAALAGHGKVDDARGEFERARALFLEAKDPEAAATMLARVAELLMGHHAYAEAAETWRRYSEDQHALHGGDHRELATGLHQRAWCLMVLGRESDALPLLEDALAMRRRLPEGDNMDTASTLSNLAQCLKSLGRPTDALPLLAESLAMRRQLFRGDDSAVATGANNLATCLQELGRPGEALPLFEESSAMTRRLFPGDHRDVATSLRNLGYCLDALGRAPEALPLFEESLAMRRRLSPGDDPDVAQGLSDVAACLVALGRADEALPLAEASLGMRTRLFNGDHPDVAIGLNDLAACLHRLGRAREALTLHEQSLAMRRRLFPGGHPAVALSLSNVASSLEALGRAGEALALCEESLAICTRLFPGEHPDVAASLDSMAICLQVLGRAEEALPAYQKSLAMRRHLFPGDHPDVAASLNNVAGCLLGLGRTNDALPLYEQSLEMKRRLLHGDHPDVAVSLNNVAVCLLGLDRAGDALPLFQESLEMSRRIFQDDHPSVLVGLGNLAGCLQALGRVREASPLIEEAVAIGRRSDSPLGWMCATQLASARLASGEPRLAIPLLEEAVDRIEALRGIAVVLTERDRAAYFEELKRFRSYKLIVRAQRACGNDADALRFLERARARSLLDLLDRSRLDPLAEVRRQAEERSDAELLAAIAEVSDALEGAEAEVGRRTYGVAALRPTGHETGEREAVIRKASADLTAARLAEQEVLRRRARLIGAQLRVAQPADAAALQRLAGPEGRVLVYSVAEEGTTLFFVPPAGSAIRALDLAWPDGTKVTAKSLAEKADEHARRIGEGRADARGVAREGKPGGSWDAGRALFQALVPGDVWTEACKAKVVCVVADGALQRLAFESLPVGDGFWIDAGPPVVYGPSGSALLWSREQGDRQRPQGRLDEVVVLGDPVFARDGPPEKGVVVVGVTDDGQAKQVGIEPGDVIVAYGGKEIAVAEALGGAIREGSGEPTLALWRAGERREVKVAPGALGVQLSREPVADALQRLRSLDPVLMRAAAERSGELSRYGELVPLPGTRREAEAIAKALGSPGPPPLKVSLLLGEDATAPNLRRAAPRARYLHLATHGLSDETEFASYSSLALTLPRVPTAEDDGFLSLADVLAGWRGALTRCELVVLSACETQRGFEQRDEGVFALPVGFLYAGAPSVIGSLWRVDDASTAELFADFYRRLREGKGKLEAFTEARKALKKKHPEPYFWAPFVYVGDPR